MKELKVRRIVPIKDVYEFESHDEIIKFCIDNKLKFKYEISQNCYWYELHIDFRGKWHTFDYEKEYLCILEDSTKRSRNDIEILQKNHYEITLENN